MAAAGWFVLIESFCWFPVDSSPHPTYRKVMQRRSKLICGTLGTDSWWSRNQPGSFLDYGYRDVGAHTVTPLTGARVEDEPDLVERHRVPLQDPPPFWSPAAKIAHELGIAQAHCYEVSNSCNAGMVAVKLADDQVRAGTHKYALVIIADRLSELVEYGTGYIELFNCADGAAAVLVSADAKYEVLGAAHHTDPQWVDSYYGEIKDGEIKVERGEKLDGLDDAFLDNSTTLTHRVLADLGREVADVAGDRGHGRVGLHLGSDRRPADVTRRLSRRHPSP